MNQRDMEGKMTGIFTGNARGFGFVQVEGQEEDLFIPEDMTGGAFHRDTVEVELLPEAGHRRREARVLQVLERGIRQVVGTYEAARENYGFVVPDDPRFRRDIFIPREHTKGAVDGSKVVVKLTGYGGEGRNPEGMVQEVLGHVNDPGVDILSIVKGYELPMVFPEKVSNQAERVAKEVSPADMAGRRDLRDVLMVTIDGEDAKDLDDAVSVTFDGEKYHLGVHIADVTNYVQENSALDREALKRGTSVYLADRVIPMLPHTLSNGICSLNQGVDRLALSCLMTVDTQGGIADYEICESVIRVNKRMSYRVVKELLECFPSQAQQSDMACQEKPWKETASCQVSGAYSQYEGLLPMFRQMADLSGILRRKREKRGSIGFDFPECKILLDREGHPLEIQAYERNVATDIIEDFMLAANETIAQHFYWLELPFVYRVHDVPDGEKIRKLQTLIHNFGYYMKAVGRGASRINSEEVHPKEIQKLLVKIAGTPEESLISRLALRSMRQAKYSTACTGHYGLACPYYCHFTSPIRRYPDLQIHRIIKDHLRGRLKEERVVHYRDILPEVAELSSKMERRADEAQRETEKLKKVEYMEAYLGECFEGVISQVTGWGIYVELPNTVEGLVHVSRLPGEYYVYNESTMELVGEETGRSFKLGMPVKIRVESCDRFSRTIHFAIDEEENL